LRYSRRKKEEGRRKKEGRTKARPKVARLGLQPKKPGLSQKSWLFPRDIEAETGLKAPRASRNVDIDSHSLWKNLWKISPIFVKKLTLAKAGGIPKAEEKAARSIFCDTICFCLNSG